MSAKTYPARPALGYDRNLLRKGKEALRDGSKLLIVGRDRIGYFAVYKLSPGEADKLLGMTDDAFLAQSLRMASFAQEVA